MAAKTRGIIGGLSVADAEREYAEALAAYQAAEAELLDGATVPADRLDGLQRDIAHAELQVRAAEAYAARTEAEAMQARAEQWRRDLAAHNGPRLTELRGRYIAAVEALRALRDGLTGQADAARRLTGEAETLAKRGHPVDGHPAAPDRERFTTTQLHKDVHAWNRTMRHHLQPDDVRHAAELYELRDRRASHEQQQRDRATWRRMASWEDTHPQDAARLAQLEQQDETKETA